MANLKRATLVVEKSYLSDKVFDEFDSVLNRDHCLQLFIELKRALRASGFELRTQDHHPVETSELVIYNELPVHQPPGHIRSKACVLVFESELIRPENWNRELWTSYGAIFTWHSPFVDHERVFQFSFAHKFPKAVDRNAWSERSLCTLIAGNKSVNHSLELYSARKEAIQWFESNHPADFEFYGVGWDRPYLGTGLPAKLLKKSRLDGLFPMRPPKSYRGPVVSKIETLKNYRFSVCFENARDIEGYITEKIFDSLFAGCIPIYWGAPDIEKWIPAPLYLDFSKFSHWADCYERMQAVTEREAEQFWNAADQFLQSPSSQFFEASIRARDIVATAIRKCVR